MIDKDLDKKAFMLALYEAKVDNPHLFPVPKSKLKPILDGCMEVTLFSEMASIYISTLSCLLMALSYDNASYFC